jgi:hypothetical protein
MKLTQDRLKKLLRYSPDEGIFYCRGGGLVRGAHNGRGYRRIRIDRKRYLTHILAWLYEVGEMPQRQIDHINGDKNDNRFQNLRLSTQAENIANKRRQSNNKSGFKGVCLDKRRGKYKAEIQKGTYKKFLGYFVDPSEAHEAYVAAAQIIHGEFARAA